MPRFVIGQMLLVACKKLCLPLLLKLPVAGSNTCPPPDFLVPRQINLSKNTSGGHQYVLTTGNSTSSGGLDFAPATSMFFCPPLLTFSYSTPQDVSMHLHNFSKLCNMTRIRDYDPDALKLCLFRFYLRGKEKEWLLALSIGNIISWADYCSEFLPKFCPPAKIMKLPSQITSFKKEDFSTLR